MRHARRDVLSRARREFAALDRLVSGLSAVDWKRRVPRPPTRDPWTVKDALAHIVYWKEHTARVIRGERRPPEMRGLDVNQINRLVYQRWRDRRPRDVLAWHRQVQADVLRTLGRTPEAWFARRDHAPEWPADFDGHSAAHRIKDIEAALADARAARMPAPAKRTRRAARRPAGAAPARARQARAITKLS